MMYKKDIRNINKSIRFNRKEIEVLEKLKADIDAVTIFDTVRKAITIANNCKCHK